MLPIIVCDDHFEYGNHLRSIIENFILIEELDMNVVMTATSSNEVLTYISKHPASYLYFLDVDLNDQSHSGIALANKIRQIDPRGFIVFVTAHAEFSLLTFQYQVEAMDYIIKDCSTTFSNKIRQCIMHAMSLHTSPFNQIHKTFSVHIGSRIIHLKQDDIICFKSSNSSHKINIITSNAFYEQSGTLHEIQNQVDHNFRFSHKSYLVNTNHIQEIDKASYKLILSNGLQVPVSVRNMQSFLKPSSNVLANMSVVK